MDSERWKVVLCFPRAEAGKIMRKMWREEDWRWVERNRRWGERREREQWGRDFLTGRGQYRAASDLPIPTITPVTQPWLLIFHLLPLSFPAHSSPATEALPCSFYALSAFQPQGLCTCCLLCLECSSPGRQVAADLPTFGSQLKYLPPREFHPRSTLISSPSPHQAQVSLHVWCGGRLYFAFWVKTKSLTPMSRNPRNHTLHLVLSSLPSVLCTCWPLQLKHCSLSSLSPTFTW